MTYGGNCGVCSVLPLGCGALYNQAAGDQAGAPLAWAYDEALAVVAFRSSSELAGRGELVIDYGMEYWSSRGKKPEAQ